MDDDEIARVLAFSDPGTAARGVRSVADLAAEVRARHRARARRQKTARWVLPSLVLAGGLAVTTAGTDLQAFFLSRPPFVGINPSDQRPAEGVRYVPASGVDMGERCLLFVDYSGLEPEEAQILADAIDSGAWEEPIAEAAAAAVNSLGIEPLSNEARTDAAHDAEVSALNDVIRRLSVAAVPTIDGDEKLITALTMTCREGLW